MARRAISITDAGMVKVDVAEIVGVAVAVTAGAFIMIGGRCVAGRTIGITNP